MSLFKGRPAKPAQIDWYAAASEEERREYDAFGPWIYQVKAEAEMPKRFRSAWPELAKAAFILKIPINQERRLVRPGQDLYQQILAVDNAQVCLLSLSDRHFEQKSLPLADIQAIASNHVLLLGGLIIYLSDSTQFTVNYNAVSKPLMDQVVDFLRVQMNPTAIAGTLAPKTRAKLEVEDFYFNNLIREQEVRQPLAHVAYDEAPGIHCTNDKGRRRRSLGTLIFESSSELTIITRGKATRKAREAVYATNTWFIPKARLQGCALSGSNQALPKSGRELKFDLTGQSLRFQVFGDFARLNGLVNV